jgi:hypothetical protein
MNLQIQFVHNSSNESSQNYPFPFIQMFSTQTAPIRNLKQVLTTKRLNNNVCTKGRTYSACVSAQASQQQQLIIPATRPLPLHVSIQVASSLEARYIASPLKHLAHKVRVSMRKGMILLPHSILWRLPRPTNEQFSD